MFNGIIKHTGNIVKIHKKNNNCILSIFSNMKFANNEIGASISCSGTCLTLYAFKGNISKFYLSKETLNRTNFKYAKEKNIINLEKSLKYGSRISGHFVQGHVDATCNVNKIDIIGKSWSIKFSLSSKYRKFVVEKGSIAINGVSLTISNIFKNEFQVVVIPQTLKYTNLIKLNKKDTVNVEFDVLGKYINNSLK
jgi:riboflavin synthase